MVNWSLSGRLNSPKICRGDSRIARRCVIDSIPCSVSDGVLWHGPKYPKAAKGEKGFRFPFSPFETPLPANDTKRDASPSLDSPCQPFGRPVYLGKLPRCKSKLRTTQKQGTPMKTQVFEYFTAEAAARQRIRHFNEQVPKNKPYAEDFFLRGLPKGERLGRSFPIFSIA